MAKYQKFPPKADSWAAFRRVDFVKFLQDNHSYQVDIRNSSDKNNGNLLPIIGNKTQIEMFIPDANGKKSSFLIVRKSLNGEYFYTAPNGNEGEGSIIDFLCNRYGLSPKTDGGKIAKLITDFDVTAKSLNLPKYVPPAPLPTPDRNAIVARFYKLLKGFDNPEYLMARGLDKETINAEEFKKRIFNSIYKDKETQEVIINTIFPLVDKNDKLCGIQYKNYKGGGLLKASDRLLWKSNVLSKQGTIKEIVIGEAEIDLMSYAQLNNKLGKDVLFVSHLGSLYDLQINAIQHLINQHQPENITLVTDRDRAGRRFDTDFIGQLTNPNGKAIENDLKAINTLYDRNTINLTIDLSFESILQGKTRVNDLLNKFRSFNDDDDIIFKIKDDSVSYGNNSAKMIVEYPNTETNIINAQQIILQERNLENFIKIEKPTGADLNGEKIKDWNQKLMTEKKIQKEDIKLLMDKLSNNTDSSKVMLENAFSPKDLVITFIKEWNSETLNTIKEAVQAGVSEQMLANMVTKGQLASFDKYVETINRNLDSEGKAVQGFEDYRKLLSDEIEKSDIQLLELNKSLVETEKKLSLVKNTLTFEENSLSTLEFEEKLEQQKKLTTEFNALRKKTGTFNEFTDGAKLQEAEKIVNRMTNKQWERIVRTQLNLPLRQEKVNDEINIGAAQGVRL